MTTSASRKTGRWLLAASAAIAAMCLVAPSAAHSAETTCVGVLGPIVVDDVVVPPDALCSLEGTRALGDVMVSPGSQLTANGARIEGSLEVRGFGYLRAFESTIGRDVVCAEAFCVLEQSEVFGDAFVGGPSGTELIATRTTIRGGVDVESRGSFGASEAEIGRDVRCVDCDFIDVIHSSVAGSIRVTGDVYFGPGIFDSRIAGDVVFSRSFTRAPEEYRIFIEQNTIAGRLVLSKNSYSIDVANNIVRGDLDLSRNEGFARHGESAIAVAGNEVGRDLDFIGNTGSATISLNTIAGALWCRGNDPAPVSAGNVFAEALGQCAA
jgi:hypothetical protein